MLIFKNSLPKKHECTKRVRTLLLKRQESVQQEPLSSNRMNKAEIVQTRNKAVAVITVTLSFKFGIFH